ncbi:MAG: RecX family transcriptional regulator [Nitrospinae bacterium]|nr:RecX family transcriptional regulator [Nitrospinota bacterium]
MEEEREFKRGIQIAYRAISRREKSTEEIRHLLENKEVEETVIEEIIQKLTKEKYLDDRRFTEIMVRSKKNYTKDGPLKIKQFLYKKGIREDLADQIIEEKYPPEEELSIINELIMRKHVSPKKNFLQKKQFLYNFLMNKGFSPQYIMEELNEHIKKE